MRGDEDEVTPTDSVVTSGVGVGDFLHVPKYGLTKQGLRACMNVTETCKRAAMRLVVAQVGQYYCNGHVLESDG